MKIKSTKTIIVAAALLVTGSFSASGQSELYDLKAKMKVMEQMMQQMQQKITDLEQQRLVPAPTTASSTGEVTHVTLAPAPREVVGHASPIENRPSLNNQQEGAPRPKDYTLDPQYRGFFPIPNTPALIKFNAKPRVDMTSDSRNSGNNDRFATATIPVKGQADYGGSEQFNINARGSQLSVDVRAPDMAGDFRFFYQNDFFGSGGGMAYRLKHMYGQIYNFTAGFTYSCFEDPDAWPDTVDYEGPNSVIFARRALGRYMLEISDAWQMNFGVEAPSAEIDENTAAGSVRGVNSWPDATMNVRWENAKWGHVQLGSVARGIGARGTGVGNQSVFGWGFNLASSINVWKKDSAQAQLTYGEGIFRYMNDDFINNDAAFDTDGDLKPIPVFGAMAGYTHHWNDAFRSTATFGFINLENEPSQGPDAYDKTYYGSLNLVWQLRKHLSVGFEGLYGKKETQDGRSGDVWRAQVGMVYSLFD